MARDTLGTLIRLAGTEVDAARQSLQGLLGVEDMIRGQLSALDAEVEREGILAREDPSYATSFGQFMLHAKQRREGLESSLADLLPKIEDARDILADAFANQKKYEIAKSNRDAAAVADANRRENLDLDEQGLNAHRRKAE